MEAAYSSVTERHFREAHYDEIINEDLGDY